MSGTPPGAARRLAFSNGEAHARFGVAVRSLP